MQSSNTGIPILILSCSRQGFEDRRMACRETWIEELPEYFRPYFVLGFPRLPVPWRFDGDILRVRCDDGYEFLTEKVRLGLLALLERFDPPWIFKCDDDTWVNPWKFADLPFAENDLAGFFAKGLEKGYASGAGYSLSRRAAEAAILALETAPPGTAEDLFVGGVIASHPDFTRHHIAGFRPFSGTEWEPSLLGHWIRGREAMLEYHGKSRQEHFADNPEPQKERPAPSAALSVKPPKRLPRKRAGNQRIHVQVAAYREADLVPTLRNLYAQAADPKRVEVAICWQHAENETLEEFHGHPRVKIVDVPWQKSQGLGWARRITQYLVEDQQYTFQIDAHERFVAGWDAQLIEMMELVDAEKPIISTYPAAFDPAEERLPEVDGPSMIHLNFFREDGSVSLRYRPIANPETLTQPVPARFLAGGFFFTLGQHCREVIYDPALYFNDEISMAARSFTHGYDLFHPHRHLAWHHYTRTERRRHWDDHTPDAQDAGQVDVTWQRRVLRGRLQLQQLFGQVDHGIPIPETGFGSVRTLADYEAFAGMDFRERLIHEATLAGEHPPVADHPGRYRTMVRG